MSIGTNPTFSGRERRVEAYVLDFDGDLYGERVSLDFVAHLRETARRTTGSSRWSRRSSEDVDADPADVLIRVTLSRASGLCSAGR